MSKLLIDGEWVDALEGDTIDVIDPCSGQVFEKIARGRAADVDLAVAAARRALDGPWGRMTATERGRIMQRLGQLILEHGEELAQLEARDTGKPMSVARADAKAVARYFEFYGGAADKVHGQTIPYLNGYNVSVVRIPHGVTAHIIPWNYPAQMMGRTLAPALAMGNAAVVKPSEDACLSALKLAELAMLAGLPPGALNIVTGYGTEAGAALTAHPGINFATFTGSPEVGVQVQQSTARHHVPCVLELGGKSPQIVFDDADLAKAAPIIVRALVQNAGQTCSAGSRLLVQEGIYDRFVATIAASFEALKVGTPEMDLDCGPLINARHQQRVGAFIADAVAMGVPKLAEGSLAPGIPPTASSSNPCCSARCHATTAWRARRCLARCCRSCRSRMKTTRCNWPTPRSTASSPASGRRTATARRAWHSASPAGRFLSIATARAGVSSCRSAASRKAVMAARKGCSPWKR